MGKFQLNKKEENPIEIYNDIFKIAQGTVESHLDKLGKQPKPISRERDATDRFEVDFENDQVIQKLPTDKRSFDVESDGTDHDNDGDIDSEDYLKSRDIAIKSNIKEADNFPQKDFGSINQWEDDLDELRGLGGKLPDTNALWNSVEAIANEEGVNDWWDRVTTDGSDLDMQFRGTHFNELPLHQQNHYFNLYMEELGNDKYGNHMALYDTRPDSYNSSDLWKDDPSLGNKDQYYTGWKINEPTVDSFDHLEISGLNGSTRNNDMMKFIQTTEAIAREVTAQDIVNKLNSNLPSNYYPRETSHIKNIEDLGNGNVRFGYSGGVINDEIKNMFESSGFTISNVRNIMDSGHLDAEGKITESYASEDYGLKGFTLNECPKCKGRKYVDGTWGIPYDTDFMLANPDVDYGEPITCPRCNGSGMVSDVDYGESYASEDYGNMNTIKNPDLVTDGYPKDEEGFARASWDDASIEDRKNWLIVQRQMDPEFAEDEAYKPYFSLDSYIRADLMKDLQVGGIRAMGTGYL